MADKVTVLIDDAYRSRFDEVVELAKAAGLHVEQLLRETGVVAGSIEPARRPDLERVEGVAAVDTQRKIQLPPPNADIN